ncbi:MAG: CsgG/HfaB family protein [Terracidiphilus sp.]|jgi:hypothetical protein
MKRLPFVKGSMLKARIAILDFCDQDFHNNCGQGIAVRLADRLSASDRYRVVERSEWHRQLGGRELSQECRRHPAWAIYLGNLVGADAVVIGSVCATVYGQIALTATMFSTNGITLAEAVDPTVEGLAERLRGDWAAVNIRNCDRKDRVVVAGSEGSLVILNAGTGSGLKPGDQLRLDRILETISDPCFRDHLRPMASLIVPVGYAQIIEAGHCASLARYTGNRPILAGDLAFRLEC